MINDPLGSIDYSESGFGPTVVFVPGSCSTGAAWRPIIARLDDRFRCVTTSLPGYGGTAERRTPIDPPMVREVEVLEAVIRRAAGRSGEPVHVVGHSFGGLVGLVVALRRQVKLAGLLIAEAPAAEVLRACGEMGHYQAFRDMTEDYFAAFQRGQPEAIASMIDFYGGPGTFSSWPARAREYAIATTHVNIMDWTSGYGIPLSPVMLRNVDLPTHIVCGALSHPAVKRANELLSIHLPNASFGTIRNAAHFMISTHPSEMADLIATAAQGFRPILRPRSQPA